MKDRTEDRILHEQQCELDLDHKGPCLPTWREQPAPSKNAHYNFDYFICPSGFYGIRTIPPDPHSKTCQRVTKTLWIDGRRIGTIREVEEK